MSQQTVTEVVLYRLKSEASEDEFLRVVDDVFADLRAMPGFVDRQLLRDHDGQWADIGRWRTLEDAQRAGQAFEGLASAQQLIPMVEMSSVHMTVLAPVKGG